jgi:hypothetical protein
MLTLGENLRSEMQDEKAKSVLERYDGDGVKRMTRRRYG